MAGVVIADARARILLQRVLLLLTRVRHCDQACARSSDFCEDHERDWERLEKDIRSALGGQAPN